MRPADDRNDIEPAEQIEPLPPWLHDSKTHSEKNKI